VPFGCLTYTRTWLQVPNFGFPTPLLGFGGAGVPLRASRRAVGLVEVLCPREEPAVAVGVWSLGFGIWGLGFEVWSLGFGWGFGV
jgi:hypothetical protein